MVDPRKFLALASLFMTAAAGCGETGGTPRAGSGGGGAPPAGNGSGGENAGGAGGAPIVGCRRGGECTVDLAIDDDIGSYCATRGNGTYRCWQDGQAAENTLPDERYQRVLLSRAGLVGLTSDGRILGSPGATELFEPADHVVDIQTTNMWGFTSICTLNEDGVAEVGGIDPSQATSERDSHANIPGRFRRSLCAWEGLTAGIRDDGSVVMGGRESLSGNDFTDLAVSVAVLCGLRGDRSISCAPSYRTERCTTVDQSVTCVPMPVPVFVGQDWLDVAATFSVGCAIHGDGELFCQHVDGRVLVRDAGPYVRVEAGKNIVCALRTEGTTACFAHETPGADFFSASSLQPLSIDSGW